MKDVHGRLSSVAAVLPLTACDSLVGADSDSATRCASTFHGKFRRTTSPTGRSSARRSPDRQNGLYDVGNLDSPPDTSFVISDLGTGYDLLQRDDQAVTGAARETYAAIMRKSARALATGGCTPRTTAGRSARLWPT